MWSAPLPRSDEGGAAYLFHHLDAVRDVLREHPLGLITDVDGTIAPIARTPAQARVSAVVRRALSTLARRLAVVAALSGRSAAEMRQMVGIPNMAYSGNHGLEWWCQGHAHALSEAEPYRATVGASLEELRSRLPLDGILFEDKGVSASIHYRRCPDPILARRAILAAAGQSSVTQDLRIGEGKMVVELRPPIAASKGTALRQLAARYGLRGALYLGDDATDEDAFDELHRWRAEEGTRGLAVAVADEETPERLMQRADLFLRGVGDVERFLLWLIRASV